MSKKIKSIVVDTLTGIQQNQYMSEVGKSSHDKWKNYGTDIYKFVLALQKRGFEIVMVLGTEGGGKSYAMKNLESGTNIWYNADNKNPTWLGGREEYGTKTKPTKFNVIPKSYKDITDSLDALKTNFAEYRVAFLTGHVDDYKSGRDNRQRLKVLGNMAHKQNIEGKMEVTLYSHTDRTETGNEYYFSTVNNGLNTCRSSEGLFETEKIPNDYKLVLDALEKY